MISNIPVSNFCGARILGMEIISIVFCSKGRPNREWTFNTPSDRRVLDF